MPLTFTSMSVPPFLASTLASPLAFGATGVPTKITLVDPPPTSYPSALMDFLTTSESGTCGLACANTHPAHETANTTARKLLVVCLMRSSNYRARFQNGHIL